MQGSLRLHRDDRRFRNHGFQVRKDLGHPNTFSRLLIHHVLRDENGIRPLCLGSRPSETLEGATDYFMASESVALTQLGFGNIVDILPGQAVFIEKGGNVQFCQVTEQKSYAPDIFEYFYFARPDTYMDGISVHRSRELMGRKLAQKMKRTMTEEQLRGIDVSKYCQFTHEAWKRSCTDFT